MIREELAELFAGERAVMIGVGAIEEVIGVGAVAAAAITAATAGRIATGVGVATACSVTGAAAAPVAALGAISTALGWMIGVTALRWVGLALSGRAILIG